MYTANDQPQFQRESGLLITFFGLPGSGKSTTCKCLADLIDGAQSFLEPNEAQWPEAVLNRHKFGKFTAITWFRAMRLPLLYRAQSIRNNGLVALVDSYYDKLISEYIEFPAMQWLLPSDDPYIHVARELFQLDYQLLPDADCLIFLRIAEADWRELLRGRGRAMDSESDFLNQYSSQEAFLNAAESFSRRAGATLIVHDQKMGSPEQTATAILEELNTRGTLRRHA